MSKLLTTVTHVGQKYVDKPVYETMAPKPLANAVRAAFDHPQLQQHRHLKGYERTRIAWVKPGDSRLKAAS